MKFLILNLTVLVVPLLVAGCRGGSGSTTGELSVQAVTGKTLYETHCAACHGINGEGQPNWKVPNAEGVYPAPPHNNEGHTWHHADSLLLEIMANGGSLPTSAMPGFKDKLGQAEMEAILAYLKTMWGPE
ncbi:MAG TPA: cytochrome c, partial [Anaerolineae bacterium]|nr:cytochrome c [Anaerolineae bacterium]